MAELAEILEEHRRWLDSEGREGSRADLRGMDLRKARLDGAHLEHALLREANLADVNLGATTGLLAGQLGGTNVSGARLPDAIAKFDAFSGVVDAAKSLHTLAFTTLAAVAYAVLTIGAARDANLLANSGLTQLPIVGTQVPIVQFFWLGPLVLVLAYLYYLLSALRVCELLAELPAIFPDGRPLDRKLNALLLSALVRGNLRHLKGERPPLSSLQANLAVFVSWWIVPLTLGLFWARYLRRHDWAGTWFHILVLALAVHGGVALYRLALSTLAGQPAPPAQPWVALGVALPLALLSLGAIEGVPSDAHGQEIHALAPADPRRWVPQVFEWLELNPNADVQGAELSQKPANWIDGPGAVHHVKGAHLSQRQLRHARAAGAFFVNADLRGAQLEGAILTGADLRGVDLRGADLSHCEAARARLAEAELQGALLVDANLARAELSGADLKSAHLAWVDLQAAQLSGARLSGADLSQADLLQADLRGADLKGSNLSGAHLEGADLREASGLTQAQLDSAHTNLETLVSPPHRVSAAPPVQPSPRWRHP